MKSPNLRFLLSLGSTKIVVLQDETDLQIYSKHPAARPRQKQPIVPEHIAEALTSK